jgi:hypothetical protein
MALLTMGPTYPLVKFISTRVLTFEGKLMVLFYIELKLFRPLLFYLRVVLKMFTWDPMMLFFVVIGPFIPMFGKFASAED